MARVSPKGAPGASRANRLFAPDVACCQALFFLTRKITYPTQERIRTDRPARFLPGNARKRPETARNKSEDHDGRRVHRKKIESRAASDRGRRRCADRRLEVDAPTGNRPCLAAFAAKHFMSATPVAAHAPPHTPLVESLDVFTGPEISLLLLSHKLAR